MNIADQIYSTMYDIIVNKLLPSLVTVLFNLNSTEFFRKIVIIAIAVIGLLMIYGKMNRVTFIKSFITISIVYSLFISPFGNFYLLETLRSLFVDGPIKYGTIIVNTIASVIYEGVIGITQQTINLEPSTDGTGTAFGKLWQISTDLASAVWSSGGLSDIGSFLIGFALYAVAVFLLVVQILMLGTFLIMSAAAIYVAPLFIPMVLFTSTRQMFQSWVGFGLGGAFGLIMLMIMMGIIFGFISITFLQVFGIDLSTGDVGNIDDISDIGKIGAMIVFMLISIKLLPKIEMWASSLAGASAAGISDASMAVGSMIGKATGLTAKAAGKQLNERVAKPVAGVAKRRLGRAVEKFKNRSAKSNKGSKPNDTKQKLANAKLKNSIRNRLVARGQEQKRPLSELSNKEKSIQKRQTIANKLVSRGQDQKRPLSELSNKEKSIQKRQTIANKKPQSSQGQSQPPKANNTTKTSSRDLNKSSESQKKVSTNNNEKPAQRPTIKNESSRGSNDKQKIEKTTKSKTENQNSQSSTSTTNTSSERSKPIDRNTKIKEKKARETQRKQLDALQTQQETKRRETSKKPAKNKKKGDNK